MPERIAKRYELNFEREAIGPVEYWIAQDWGARETGALVQLLLLRQGQVDSLTDAVVRRRVDDLCHARYPGLIPLIDFGFDGSKNIYYFAYPLASGLSLKKYAEQVDLRLRNVADFLAEIIKLLQYLQSTHISRPWISPEQVFLTKDQNGWRSLTFNLVGLADLIDTLRPSGRSPETAGSSTEPTSCATVMARFLLSNGRPETTVEQMLVRLPEGCRDELTSLLKGQLDPDSDALSEARRLVAALDRELAKEEVYYVQVTNNVVTRLYENGCIQAPEDYLALEFLNLEFARPVAAWRIESNDNDALRYRFSTGQLRLFVAPDQRTSPPRHLAAIGLALTDPVELHKDHEKGYPIAARLDARPGFMVPQAASVAPLLQRIDEHVQRATRSTNTEVEQKDALGLWDELLQYQQKVLRSISYAYSSLQLTAGGHALTVTLGEPPEELSLAEDELLRLTSPDGRQIHAGYFEDLQGNILKIGLAAGVDPDSFKPDGVVTIDNAQVEAVLKRQREALKRVRYAETVNPDLPFLLTGVGQTRPQTDASQQIDIWFQSSLDDSQRAAVRHALAAKDLYLVHGPPGTGKTSVIAELVLQIIHAHDTAKILISSQSNVAVNHALAKIVELRPELAEKVVRFGREDKAESAERLLLDRQMRAWSEKVLGRSRAYVESLQKQVKSDRGLVDAISIVDECALTSQRITEAEQDVVTLRARLEEVERDYVRMEQILAKLQASREQGALIAQRVHEGDDQLRHLLRQFEESYLPGLQEMLDAADHAARLSSRRVETLHVLQARMAEIENAREQIDVGVNLVNEYLHSKYRVSFSSHAEQQEFLNSKAAAEKEKISRLARAQRIAEEWQQRLSVAAADMTSAYLGDCNVVGATCIGVAAKGEVNDMEFDWVIVDEAGKATPPELLVPMVRGRKVVLVGDHLQLPPTIDQALSEAAEELQTMPRSVLQTSLFETLMRRDGFQEVTTALDIQYRMHPAIGALIGACFYGGPDALKPGIPASDREHGLPWCSRPVVWFTTRGQPHSAEVQTPRRSYRNEAEIQIILDLLNRLNEAYCMMPEQTKTVGIITGYSAQKADLRQRIEGLRSQWPSLRSIEVNTVDAYQGRERDVIIYSVVRSNPQRVIGFLRDERRLNVALSRAREVLFVVGNTDVEYAQARGQNPFRDVLQFMRAHPEDYAIREWRR